MIGTNERRKLNNIYNNWVEGKNDLEPNSAGILLWLQTHGMINEDAAERYLTINSGRINMDKKDMSKTCGFKDAEMDYMAGKEITYKESEKWFNENCRQCIWASDICMYGEE
jgi:hypothetical protein